MKKIVSILALLTVMVTAQSIEPKNFYKTIKSHKVVLVEFWAPWYPGCSMLRPQFKKAKKAIGKKALLVEYNVDLDGEPLRKYNITTIPTMLLFVDGKITDISKSILSSKDIKEWVLGYIPQ